MCFIILNIRLGDFSVGEEDFGSWYRSPELGARAQWHGVARYDRPLGVPSIRREVWAVARLLVLEDESVLARHVKGTLERAGHAVDVVETIAGGIQALGAAGYDLLVLDRHVPDGDGTGLLDFVRQAKSAIPVMFLTARSGTDDRVGILNRGADDYLCKPFEAAELVARVTALLRRPQQLAASTLTAGNIVLDKATRSAMVAGKPLVIARRESMLLEQLVVRSGQVVTREALDAKLFGFGDGASPNAIEASVYRLRSALSNLGADHQIHTVRGIGYCFAP
ncbi:response regulator transcription factor [Mesorhizobium sp. AR02]|uniref:response regulator transcription factor n=1 Tax=Mesorhizobium sp. AR02 TaxID=2865837 RepID=UPI00215FE892|nr:response regulator transcription factor [Mesorhizobium sp. AR02]UVK54900.1 response regulator transcription factor [Mesorhizobium sp. AR02]